DIGREYNAACAGRGRRERSMLFGERKFAVQGQDLDPLPTLCSRYLVTRRSRCSSLAPSGGAAGGEGMIGQRIACAFDLALARQEHEHVTIILREREFDRVA